MSPGVTILQPIGLSRPSSITPQLRLRVAERKDALRALGPLILALWKKVEACKNVAWLYISIKVTSECFV